MSNTISEYVPKQLVRIAGDQSAQTAFEQARIWDTNKSGLLTIMGYKGDELTDPRVALKPNTCLS